MMEMFEVSLHGTRELIRGQVRQVEDGKGLTARAIFFSGGLSRNKYVLRELEALANELGLRPFSGSDSWTAVAKGAALMAMDIGCGPLLHPNIPCPFHIGVVLATRYTSFDHELRQKYKDTFDGVDRAKDHIQWVVARGDLVTTDGITERVKITRKFLPGGSLTGQINVVVSRCDGPRKPPSRFMVDDDGEYLVHVQHVLDLLGSAVTDASSQTHGFPTHSATISGILRKTNAGNASPPT